MWRIFILLRILGFLLFILALLYKIIDILGSFRSFSIVRGLRKALVRLLLL